MLPDPSNTSSCDASAFVTRSAADGTVLLTATETLAVATFPAESVAVAVITWTPSAYAMVFSGSVQVVVPVAGCGDVPSTDTSTFATAPLSDAVPATVTVPLVAVPCEGTEMATAGGVVSQGFLLLQA